MAGTKNTTGPVVAGPELDIDIAKDYNVPPPVTAADLYQPPPAVSNSHLPDPKVLAKTAEKPTVNQIYLTCAKPGEPEPYCVGHCIADGAKVVAADDSGERLVMDWLWSVGEIEEYVGFYVGSSFEGLGDALGKIQHFRGTSGQSASSILVALKGSYDALPNKAHSVVSFRNQASLEARMEAYWLKLYDPRLSPGAEVYSANPALFLARMLVDCGYTADASGWASVAEAANYCDEPLGSPIIKRWEIGGQIFNREDLRSWIHTIQAYANCYVDITGNTFRIVPDKPRSSNHTLSADDMVEGTVKLTQAGGRSVPDSVTVVYQTFDGQRLPITYGTSGGPGTDAVYQMPFFQDAARAGRKAEEIYRKAHNGDTLEFVGFDKGLRRTIGDVGVITNAAVGLDEEEMALIEHHQVSPGRWYHKYVQYDDSNYSDVLYSASGNDTTLDNPYHPIAGPDPDVTEETFTPFGAEWNSSYHPQQRFKVEWLGVVWPYTREYVVTFETGGVVVESVTVEAQELAGSPLTPQTHVAYTSVPLIEGGLYTVRVYIRSNVNALSSTPGKAYITASVLFYDVSNIPASFGAPSWTNTENALGDNLTDGTYAEVEWANDDGHESYRLGMFYALADGPIPGSAEITWIQVRIRAWKGFDTIAGNPSVVNLAGVRLMADYDASPHTVGSEQTSEALTTTPTVYTFEGDLSYWGLTNEEALQMFDDSGHGWVQFYGECTDTSIIPSPDGAQYMRVDWVRAGFTFTQ